MKRIVIAATVVAAVALAAPASAQELGSVPSLSLCAPEWDAWSPDTRELLVHQLQAGGPIPEEVFRQAATDAEALRVRFGWGSFYLDIDTESDGEAYFRGYQAACAAIQDQYPDLELADC